MALQGDLDSFPLPDVLALLAGTAKSGRLEVHAGGGVGELWLRRGEMLGGSASTAPHADQPADVLYEVLRMGGGAFRFEDIEVGEEGTAVAVDDALKQAEALVQEWVAIESVVPSVWSGLVLRSELAQPVTISPDQWRLLVAIGSDATPRSVADQLGLTDLASCGQVRDLVERGLVEVHESQSPELQVPEEPTFDEVSAEAVLVEDEPVMLAGVSDSFYSAHEEVAHLSAEGGPVVIETREDALLPEPLPGESTEWHDEVAGSVDRHRYDMFEPTDFASGAGPADIGSSYPQMPAEVPLAPHTVTAVPGPLAGPGSQLDPSAYPTHPAHPAGQAGWAGPARGASAAEDEDIFVSDPASAPLSATPTAQLPPPPAAPADAYSIEDDRDSLMRFLSTVKP